ncbi:MAG: hypothetical protein ACRC6O_08705 [Flavobacterium sp.]
MAPFFTFFVDKTESERCAPFIKKLDRYYPSFADGLYVSPPDMKKKYQDSNAKFFAFDFGELLMFDLDTVTEIEPLLTLTMDKTTRMSQEHWVVVYKFLKAVFSDEYVDTDEMYKIYHPVKVPEEKFQLTKQIEITEKLPEDYSFVYTIEDNVAYCQVTKPHTDMPYTAVIRDYSSVGFEPLFTAMYVSSSWGLCNHDHVFLSKLWKYLNMDGDLDIENRLAAEIQKCQQGKPEPELYRLDISGVKEQLSKKQKRRDILNADPSKFIKL